MPRKTSRVLSLLSHGVHIIGNNMFYDDGRKAMVNCMREKIYNTGVAIFSSFALK